VPPCITSTTVPCFDAQVTGCPRCTISTVEVWCNASCSYYPGFYFAFVARVHLDALCPRPISASIPALTAVSYVVSLLQGTIGITENIREPHEAHSGPWKSLLKANNPVERALSRSRIINQCITRTHSHTSPCNDSASGGAAPLLTAERIRGRGVPSPSFIQVVSCNVMGVPAHDQPQHCFSGSSCVRQILTVDPTPCQHTQ
jgi:hypothetical protein